MKKIIGDELILCTDCSDNHPCQSCEPLDFNDWFYDGIMEGFIYEAAES